MGSNFAKVQAEIWKEGKLVEVGGRRQPGIIVGIADPSASTITVMVGGDVIDIMNPFWEGDIDGLAVSDTTSIAPVYLMEDDPYYELLTHHYDRV